MPINNAYWLYLEPYTHLTIKSDSFILYNTLSGEIIEIINNPKLTSLVMKLDDDNNLWCIEVNESEFEDDEFRELITEMRIKYIGDIIDTKLSDGKPFQFKPILNIHRDIRQDIVKFGTSGGDVMKYLNEFTFYMNSGRYDDRICSVLNKQLYCCGKDEVLEELDFKIFKRILTQLFKSGVNQINLKGLNIFKYSKFDSAIDLLAKLNIKIDIFISSKNIEEKELLRIPDTFKINILFQAPYGEIYVAESLKSLDLYDNINALFLVNSESQYMFIEQIMSLYPNVNCQMIPIYNGKNIEFFKSYVYVEKEDLCTPILSNKEIFRNMVLNTNDFGKLTILPNGEVLANLNRDTLGNLHNDSLNELIYFEIKNGSSWFKIRDMKPCSDCVYQWLCPSPSNYELAIGKPNLCHVKP